MAFLDNSGDIILDAVLTDTGRFRLAKGDGTFKIAKFAFGDDEINYQLYRNNNHSSGAHPSGSAYYDLEILQTPVLEAFTNNTSTLKSKLVSINKTNLLFMPVIKVNDKEDNRRMNSTSGEAPGTFVVTVDESTADIIPSDPSSFKGIINGQKTAAQTHTIHLDQGLDTTEIPAIFPLDAELVENQYIVEIDNRLGKIINPDNGAMAKVSFIDDDNIASYYLSRGTDPDYVNTNFDAHYNAAEFNNNGTANTTPNVILGPKGTYLRFSIMASIELQTSTNLFEKVGGTNYDWAGDSDKTIRFIDSTIRVTGATTGYRIDVPVRFVKKV
jgi:hypothetical protein